MIMYDELDFNNEDLFTEYSEYLDLDEDLITMLKDSIQDEKDDLDGINQDDFIDNEDEDDYENL